MEGPDSSYSCLLIHICWKVDREARMEPPIQTEYLRSGGAMICREEEESVRCTVSHYTHSPRMALQDRAAQSPYLALTKIL